MNLDILFVYDNKLQTFNVNIPPQESTDITNILNQELPLRPNAIILDPFDKLYMTYNFDPYSVEYMRTSTSVNKFLNRKC